MRLNYFVKWQVGQRNDFVFYVFIAIELRFILDLKIQWYFVLFTNLYVIRKEYRISKYTCQSNWNIYKVCCLFQTKNHWNPNRNVKQCITSNTHNLRVYEPWDIYSFNNEYWQIQEISLQEKFICCCSGQNHTHGINKNMVKFWLVPFCGYIYITQIVYSPT